MGFDVFGPTRHVRVSNIDDGSGELYDVLALPGEYGLRCPQIERLHGRFYESTTVRFAAREVHALRDELIQLLQAYRARREPEVIKERSMRAKSDVRRGIVERILQGDAIYRVLLEFRTLCDEAIAAESDVQCHGD